MAETGQLGGPLSLLGAMIPGSIDTGVGIGDPIVPKARVTQLVVEALQGGTPRARVTLLAVETLRKSYVPQTYFPTATTGIVVGLAAAQVVRQYYFKAATTLLDVGHQIVPVHEVFASATTAFELTVRPSGNAVRFFEVAATTGLELLHSASDTKLAVATAATGILVGQRARDAENPNLFLAATTGLEVGSGGDYFTARSYFRNAETQVLVGLATHYLRDVAAAATTGLDLLSAGDGRLPILFASAATGLEIGTAIAESVPRVLLASAATTLGLVSVEASAINTGKYLFASTNFTLRNRAAKRMSFSFDVRASTRVDIGQRAPDPLELRAYLVAAATGFALGQAGSEVRDTPASAATVLAVGAAAPFAGRDLHVAAATAMNLALIEESNEFIAVSAPSGLEVVLVATAAITGTPADSGLVFTHRADAEVALPWRRQALTLPPGGQLPHSG